FLSDAAILGEELVAPEPLVDEDRCELDAIEATGRVEFFNPKLCRGFAGDAEYRSRARQECCYSKLECFGFRLRNRRAECQSRHCESEQQLRRNLRCHGVSSSLRRHLSARRKQQAECPS